VKPARVDVEDVRAVLAVEDVIRHGDLEVSNGGSQYRLAECPRCHEKSGSKAIAINKATGAWLHHGHERAAGGQCSGDLLDLLAAVEGKDPRRDFAEIVEVAARLAGIEARPISESERAELRARRERIAAERQAAADREEASMLHEAKLRAAAMWQRIAPQRHNRTGKAYLRLERALDPDPLIDGGYVGFDQLGNPHVPLWSLDDGDKVNVVKRIITPREGEPKILGLSGCPTSGTLGGRIRDIDGKATVTIVEGVIDTLTAIQLWPDHVVLGAHGAGRMARIAEVAAPIIRARGGRLVLVPDGDDVGQRCAVRAGEAAIAAGLVMDETLVVLDLGAHKDLNDAHRAGWKP